ncbi:MAG: sigma-70 family RNA polymerase sigma factor [Sphingobacteriales bacterium]|nr:MAG: sigma-70 family RNA polymerase sigma factor [Sphingobacteriales bacterium]
MSFIRNISESPLSDKELVTLYKQDGDMQVLAQLYQRYMDLVYGVCLKYLKETETSRDAVMEIFEELVVKLKKHEVDNFKGWLHTVTKNYCLMQLRTPRNLKTKELNTDLMQSGEMLHLEDGIMEKEATFNRLQHCLGTLSPEQKQSVELFYLQNKCYNEIADITGYDWNKVRSFIQNGRRNLKLCMEQGSSE